MTFLKCTHRDDIFNALMARQRKIIVDGYEVILKPLSRDTMVRREREAMVRANKLVKLIG